ncbi:hypothetical protein [Paracraurococcus lichenis]|uniref:Lipoprotein n=1 Tax=Paracraurococcus lichenis TaxID=3064888 RepID=A0ABT9DVL1_9PROT|nr:hypothetical protein [Paracraurococcus sp. LOR1-02]MDO9707937.1 hypothetical protein [Paracraurococcus sp. LOR1-02]
MTTRILAAAGLSAALLLGGCQNPDGSMNWGNTLLLGAGVGAAAALVAGAASDHPKPHYHGSYGGYGSGYRPAYGRPAYGYGAGGYRNW